eukprot:Awhi_evm2s3596
MSAFWNSSLISNLLFFSVILFTTHKRCSAIAPDNLVQIDGKHWPSSVRVIATNVPYVYSWDLEVIPEEIRYSVAVPLLDSSSGDVQKQVFVTNGTTYQLPKLCFPQTLKEKDVKGSNLQMKVTGAVGEVPILFTEFFNASENRLCSLGSFSLPFSSAESGLTNLIYCLETNNKYVDGSLDQRRCQNITVTIDNPYNPRACDWVAMEDPQEIIYYSVIQSYTFGRRSIYSGGRLYFYGTEQTLVSGNKTWYCAKLFFKNDNQFLSLPFVTSENFNDGECWYRRSDNHSRKNEFCCNFYDQTKCIYDVNESFISGEVNKSLSEDVGSCSGDGSTYSCSHQSRTLTFYVSQNNPFSTTTDYNTSTNSKSSSESHALAASKFKMIVFNST